MRVFVAGATGVIGRPLVADLVEGGHDVVGSTRSAERAEQLRELGVEPVVLDARDADALRGAVIESPPRPSARPMSSVESSARRSPGPPPRRERGA